MNVEVREISASAMSHPTVRTHTILSYTVMSQIIFSCLTNNNHYFYEASLSRLLSRLVDA